MLCQNVVGNSFHVANVCVCPFSAGYILNTQTLTWGMSIRLWSQRLHPLTGIRIHTQRNIHRGVCHLISKFAFFHISPPLVHTTQSETEDSIQLPDPPTTCCMSGCANCVWIEYAQELAVLYKDGGKAAEKVMKTIEDPSLKIFLSLELREKLPSSEEED